MAARSLPSSELDIHRAIVKLLNATKRQSVTFWHTPNGELRDPRTAGKLKTMGVLPGVSDLIIMDGRGCFFAMEVKKPGEHTTMAQRHFLNAFRATGGKTAVVDSVKDAEFCFVFWNITRIASY
jgi:hypothetical protein